MGKITIKIGSVEREVLAPQSWNDLPTAKLLNYYSLLFPATREEYRETNFTIMRLIGITSDILGMTPAMLTAWENDCEDAEVFADELRQVVLAAMEGLFEVKEGKKGVTYSCKLNLTNNPYPILNDTVTQKKGQTKPGKVQYLYCAANELANITIYELAMAFTEFEAYLKTHEEQHADNLLAILYRPTRPSSKKEVESGYGGDRRQALRGYESKIQERAVKMRTLPLIVRRALIFWFASCRKSIVESYPSVFTTSNANNTDPGYGWGGVLLSVAGGPAGLNSVADQHYGNTLTWLSMKAQEM